MFILGCTRHVLGYCSYYLTMATTEEKLDSVLKSLEAIKKENADGQKTYGEN